MLKKYVIEMDDALARVLHNSGSIRIVEYKSEEMTRSDAMKRDSDFYCEENKNQGNFGVYGDTTGFCYYSGSKAHCDAKCKELKGQRSKKKAA